MTVAYAESQFELVTAGEDTVEVTPAEADALERAELVTGPCRQDDCGSRHLRPYVSFEDVAEALRRMRRERLKGSRIAG